MCWLFHDAEDDALNRPHLHTLRDSLSLAHLHLQKGKGIHFLVHLIHYVYGFN